MLKVRSLALAILALALLGTAGYAYRNPAFAATCKSACVKGSAWVQHQAITAESAFQKSKAYASCQEGLRESTAWRQSLSQKLAAPLAKTKQILSSASAPTASQSQVQNSQVMEGQESVSTPTDAQPQVQTSKLTAGQRIANGHAFAKHGQASGFATKAQMAKQIDHIIHGASNSTVKHLLRGRTAYWDESTGMVVIVDPNTVDGGTSFKPDRGRRYFESLR